MWHASAASTMSNEYHLSKVTRRMLRGVGDRDLGEWSKAKELEYMTVVHLRRRLSENEARMVGDVRDIRGTFEELKRVKAVSLATGQPARLLLVME